MLRFVTGFVWLASLFLTQYCFYFHKPFFLGGGDMLNLEGFSFLFSSFVTDIAANVIHNLFEMCSSARTLSCRILFMLIAMPMKLNFGGDDLYKLEILGKCQKSRQFEISANHKWNLPSKVIDIP